MLWREAVPRTLLSLFKRGLRTLGTGGGGSCTLQAAHLTSRSLIRVRGTDRRPFLQGIITNDITHLNSGDGEDEDSVSSSIYSLLLNHQGRVLFDVLIYKEGHESLLIDCHTSLRDKLIRHLKLFKLKKAVEIHPVDQLSVCAIYHQQSSAKPESVSTRTVRLVEEDSCCAPRTGSETVELRKRVSLPQQLQTVLKESKALAVLDPRGVTELGWRLICPASPPSLPSTGFDLIEEKSYRQRRFLVGVAEGPEEVPYANSFPLESNGDYLHGISFQKGCYIGQELTARTHHTGVVRKRLMPFRTEGDVKLDPDQPLQTLEIVNEKGKSVGKVRALEGQLGIGLLRIEEASVAASLTLKGGTGELVRVHVTRPHWWPIQASKDIHSTGSRT